MHTTNKTIGAGVTAALLAGALSMTALTGASAQIKGVTNCSAPGGKQEGGAVIGALAGGLLGNSVSGHNRTTGTLLGAAAGAAAGSAIGCDMQKKRARTYSQSETYTRGGYRLSSDIAPASYSRIGDTFVATRTVNLRSAPSTSAGRVGQLRQGEAFQALAAVNRSSWVLVGQNGVGVGYVHKDYVRPAGQRYAYGR